MPTIIDGFDPAQRVKFDKPSKLTKAELLVRIAELEAEVNAVYRAERPSRHEITPTQRQQRIKAFFAANPGAKSVTPSQLAAM